jgi:hypothetical protein
LRRRWFGGLLEARHGHLVALIDGLISFLFELMIPFDVMPRTDRSAVERLFQADDLGIHSSERGVLDDLQRRQTGNSHGSSFGSSYVRHGPLCVD